MTVDIIAGPREVLRPPRLEDAKALFAGLTADPEVTRYLSWRPHPDVDETRRVIVELFNVGDERTWLIEHAESGETVGLCGWRHPQTFAIDLGYCLARRWWRRGIMSEVLPVLVDAAQRDPAVYRVSAFCHVDNAGSARLLERAGLTREGRLIRYAIFPNIDAEPQDCLLFGKAVR